MADATKSLIVDPRSGFCESNSTFYSKRNALPLPPNRSLDVTTFVSSQAHIGTIAFIDAATGRRLSFVDLWRAVNRVASCLYDIGIRKSDVVLILSPNSIFFPVVCFAVMSIGAVVTTANPLNTAGEIAKQMEDCKPMLVFTTRPLLPKLASVSAAGYSSDLSIVLMDSEIAARNSADDMRANPTRGIRIAGLLGDMMKKESSGRRVRDRVYQDDTAAILYSSGTTGPSKGVICSHRNLIAHVAKFIVQPQEVLQTVICTVPMFHTMGLLNCAMTTPALGSTVVILPKFEIHDMLAAVEKYRVTLLPLVPPILVAMINGADQIKAKYDLRSLGSVLCGGAPLSKEVIEAFVEKYPTIPVLQGYALTESNGAGAATFTMEESRRYGTAGQLTAGVEAKIVDPDTGRAMGMNQTGELWLRAPSITKGYFRNEKATRSTIGPEGWLKTGDLCYIDNDGFLFVVDRLKELIKYKGYQVPPAELEALLLTHPDIVDAAVIPFPDREAGQFPMAYVVRKKGSDLSYEEVMSFVAKQVAPYKKIRKVAFIDAIPKNPSGKILRKDLAKLSTSKL